VGERAREAAVRERNAAVRERQAPPVKRADGRGPPRLVEWLFACTLPSRDRAAVLGDLAEAFEEMASLPAGRRGAVGWYVRQLIGSIPSNVKRRLDGPRALSPRWRGLEALMTSFLQDLRVSLRSVRTAPSFAAVVVLTLGLGIGAVTVVFSAVDGLVLNPFPFPEADRLVGVGTEYPKLGGELSYWENLSPAEYVDVRESSRTLRDIVAWDMGNRQVTIGDRTENLFSGFWWGDAFPTLGMRPHVGRGFLADEIARGDRVAILSHRVWLNRFGGEAGLIGGRVLINGEPYTLIGVMPPRALIYGTDLWIPMPVGPEVYPRQRRQFQLLARLAPEATLASANAELETIARRVEASYGAAMEEYDGWRLVATPWTTINVQQLRPAAIALMGAVGFVLLLVCANVASLMLGRAAGRRRELAVRAALGAGRGRLVRQLLTESVALALVGGAVGVAIGYVGVRALGATLTSLPIPLPGDLALNVRVLLVAAGASVLAGIAFGTVPALHASRLNVQRMLQTESLGATAHAARLRLQRMFVGVEVALALMLLVGGGLLVHSFVRMQAVDRGLDASNVLTMRLTLAWERYDNDAIQAFFQRLEEQVAAIPGVTDATVATQFPPGVFLRQRFFIEGSAPQSDDMLPTAYTTIVSPGYFTTLGVRTVAGRTFDDTDVTGGRLVAVVNEAAARRYFGDGSPIGRRLRLGGAGSDDPWFEVVGVVGDTRNRGLDAAPEPELFASTRQVPGGNQFFLLARTSVPPLSILAGVREQVRAIDPEQPVYAIRTLDRAFADIAAARRVSTFMLTLFALFALALAGLGIYGVVAYAVSQRTREIGLRIALGAEHAAVRRLVVRQALVPVAIGAVVGLAGAIAGARLLSSLLFDIGPTDPATLAAVVALLVGIAWLASWLPARRAARLSPMNALRYERG
jgi:putative ABC transport system permease protein